MQPSIGPLLLPQQRALGALLDQPAVLEDEQPRRLPQGREPVRDGEHRRPATSRSSASWMCRSVSVSTLLVASSRIRIRGSCRIARAIDDPLPLAARQRLAPLAHHGVVPVGELDDEVVRVRRPRRRRSPRRAWRPACRTGCSPARCRGTGRGPATPSPPAGDNARRRAAGHPRRLSSRDPPATS